MTVAEVTEAAADHTLTKSVLVLERAINALASPSADFRQILNNIPATLPRKSQTFLKVDVASFLGRAPDAGADFRCGADFLRYKARQELLRLKDTLLNDNPQPAHPQFCYALPYALDPTRPIGPIEIYGYDFDREPLQILLMNTYGFREITFALTRHTHYHLTLDLRAHGVTLSPDNQVLALVRSPTSRRRLAGMEALPARGHASWPTPHWTLNRMWWTQPSARPRYNATEIAARSADAPRSMSTRVSPTGR